MNGTDCEEDGAGAFLMPLKKKRCPAQTDCPPARAGPRVTRFEDSVEWKWTKCTSESLFRTLGRFYDETWFPTVINEWCELYYRCNYETDYWQHRDEWLAGDEEVRLAVWAEVLRHRDQHDANQSEQCDIDLMHVDDRVDAAKIMEIHGAINEANDRIELKRVDIQATNCVEKPSAAERKRAEVEAAEIALADPDDEPDWVEMRRRMRGSFAALNLARCDVSTELLDHIMIELCKYWANVPELEHTIEPLLERNIMREVQNFRFKLFNVSIDIEPEIQQSCPDAEEPEPCYIRPRSSSVPPPPPPSSPVICKRQKPRTASCRSRRPATTKLAEARARQNAARALNRENASIGQCRSRR
ncbi:uncharacterized protein LOC132926368 [Rhopalosiphum padi]|uniref:uncharacterized protein LOC132926368 n=1 Tax=Rhopalosiphum padi TaxID=40932 RepID=UPI00298D9131|nr:uncharacterized protein LOC132926368 [Rhopalosiphum padi]XP_060846704.1 uncharacterized protein LOC132926368 [Rhopalosiphum padi]